MNIMTSQIERELREELQRQIELPENVMQSADIAFEKIRNGEVTPKENIERKKFHFSYSFGRVAAVLLAVILLGGTAVYAATHWNLGLSNYLDADSQKQKLLEDNHMVTTIGQSVTKGNITITADQCVIDRNQAIISFKIEGYMPKLYECPKIVMYDVTIDGKTYKDNRNCSVHGEMYGKFHLDELYHIKQTPDTFNDLKYNYMQKDGSMTYIIRLFANDGINNSHFEKYGIHFIESLENKPVSIRLRGLGSYLATPEASDFHVISSERWDFNFTLPKASEYSKKFEFNRQIDEIGHYLKNITMTPIGIELQYTTEKPKKDDPCTDGLLRLAGIRMKDGTENYNINVGNATLNQTLGTWIFDEDGHRVADRWNLTTIIDIENVDALLFLKNEPSKKEDLYSKKNIYVLPLR